MIKVLINKASQRCFFFAMIIPTELLSTFDRDVQCPAPGWEVGLPTSPSSGMGYHWSGVDTLTLHVYIYNITYMYIYIYYIYIHIYIYNHIHAVKWWNYMVSGSQNAACFSNRGQFILRVFSQGFVFGSIFLTLLNPAISYFFFFWNSLRQTSKSLCFTCVSGLESNFYRRHLDPRKVLEEVKSVASRAC